MRYLDRLDEIREEFVKKHGCEPKNLLLGIAAARLLGDELGRASLASDFLLGMEVTCLKGVLHGFAIDGEKYKTEDLIGETKLESTFQEIDRLGRPMIARPRSTSQEPDFHDFVADIVTKVKVEGNLVTDLIIDYEHKFIDIRAGIHCYRVKQGSWSVVAMKHLREMKERGGSKG